MKRIMILTVLFLSTLLIYSQLEAADYRFVTLEYPPLEYIGDDGRPKGIAVDIIKEVMNSLGHTVEISVLPWPKALKMVREGEADAIFTIFKTPERETFLDYSTDVLIPQVVALYVKKESPITFNGDFNKLKDASIGVVSTISYGHKFDKMRSKLHIEPADRLEENFQKLLSGSNDLLICNTFEADWELKRLHLEREIVMLQKEVERVPSYIAFSKKRDLKELCAKFDEKLKAMKSGGGYNAILKKYGVKIHE